MSCPTRVRLGASVHLTAQERVPVISLLVTILILCIVFSLIWWILSMIPMPAPFAQVARVCVAVIFLLIVLYEFLPFAHLR